MNVSNALVHNQENNPREKKDRKKDRHRPNYFKDYYTKNKNRLSEYSRTYYKLFRAPLRSKKPPSDFKKLQLKKFLRTFGHDRKTVVAKYSSGKGGMEKWKGVWSKFNVFQIMKGGFDYRFRLGIENQYRDYRIGVFDIDSRGHTRIATENEVTYVKTGRGIHIFFLFKKKIGNKDTNLYLPDGTKVNFKINSYVIGVGSKYHNDHSINYELKGRNYNFYLLFDSDIEALQWFINRYNTTFADRTGKIRTERLIKECKYNYQIEIPVERKWEYLRHLWKRK